MDAVGSHGASSFGLWCAHRRNAICSAESKLKAIGSLSPIALIKLLRFYQDPYSLGNNLGPMNDNTILAGKLIDVWAWLFFALNTSMTMSIIYKIL
jgi:hypothetical protein